MPEGSKPKTSNEDGVRTSTRLLLDRILLLLGLLTFVVGLVGELLGWWGELGVLLSLSGLIAGLYSAVDRNGLLMLDGQSTTHANQETMVGNQETMVETQERAVQLLEDISRTLDERLPEG